MILGIVLSVISTILISINTCSVIRQKNEGNTEFHINRSYLILFFSYIVLSGIVLLIATVYSYDVLFKVVSVPIILSSVTQILCNVWFEETTLDTKK